MTDDGNSIRVLADQFKELVQREMDQVKKDVGLLSLKVDSVIAALNTAQQSLPFTFMTQSACQSYHAGLDKRMEMDKARLETELKRMEKLLEGKADKDVLGATLTTGRIAFGLFAWVIATILTILGTVIAIGWLRV